MEPIPERAILLTIDSKRYWLPAARLAEVKSAS
jgi:hypothetical protein